MQLRLGVFQTLKFFRKSVVGSGHCNNQEIIDAIPDFIKAETPENEKEQILMLLQTRAGKLSKKIT